MPNPLLPSSASRIIEAEAATRRGYSHVHNEDAYLVDVDSGIFTVADGMGGHRDGHVASQLLITCLGGTATPTASFEQRIELAAQAIEAANAALHAESIANPAGGISGSTVVTLVVSEDYACCLWAGDSRLYLLRNERLYLISQDHSGDSGALTRAVGAAATIEIERRIIEINDGDLFTLCSDGLLKGMTEDDLIGILSDNRDNAADRLLAKSIAGGSNDDITLVLVWINRDD